MRDADLRIPAGLTVLAALVCALEVPGLRLVGGVLLGLILPGYALALALFTILPAAERAVITVALSLATAVVGGAMLHLSPWGLDVRTWTALLTSVALAGLATAARRRDRVPVWPTTWRLGPSTTVAVVAVQALVVVGAAVALSAHPAPPPADAEGYTLLSLVPGRAGTSVLEVRSGEFRTTTYRIDLRADAKLVHQWADIVLRPSERWRVVVPTPSSADLDAYLYRENEPAAYRHAYAVGPADKDTTKTTSPPSTPESSTDAAVDLVAFPSATCRLRVPRGWTVVWADLPRGDGYRSSARSPDGGSEASCDVATPPIRPARAAAAARAAGASDDLKEHRYGKADIGGKAGWVWEYSVVVRGRPVRVLRAFSAGGELTLTWSDDQTDAFRPTVDAMLGSFGGARG